jgi:LPS-assembly lipoprotein
MWSSNRRGFILSLLALSACGFEPVLAPDAKGGKLLGKIALDVPADRDGYDFRTAFENRLGRVTVAQYDLHIDLQVTQTGVATATDGRVTRHNLTGLAKFTLSEGSQVITKDQVTSFVAHSTTGPTVSTLAAEQKAHQRLMIQLADRVVDHLLLTLD